MPALLLFCLSTGLDWHRTEVPSRFPNGAVRIVKTFSDPLSPQKRSPLGDWSFDRLSVVALKDKDSESDRIRVFGSSGPDRLVTTGRAAAFFEVLFDLNYSAFRLDHSPQFGDGCIDVYLATGGDPGGQQLFSEDPQPLRPYVGSSRVNTVYIYDVGSLTDPLEACRELAHEYGHATLPPVRIPNAPEEWVNGDLGERIYLSWLADALKSGRIDSAVTFGADFRSVRAYVSGKVDKLVSPVVLRGPDAAALAKGGRPGFDAYLGLAAYAFRHLPLDVFRRSLVLNPDQTASGYAKALVEAVTEKRDVSVSDRGSKALWIPVGAAGQVAGGTVRARKGAWCLVAVKGKVRILNPAP
ncbi:MAG: hypothetical protein JST30_12055 [Armatimonadetes bacterium]|nr:hypothetical protein [Armatimonadota bacterium]